MAKQSTEESKFVESSLKIEREKFCDLLQEQIVKGEELCKQEVQKTTSSSPYRGLYIPASAETMVYDENSKRKFLENFKRWNDYNIEIYKTAFEVPNSTYRHEYEKSTYWNLWNEDIIEEYKENIGKLINQMRSDIEKVDLIPCNVTKSRIKADATTSVVKDKDKSKVFIVHGHDDASINEVKIFLTKLGLIPVVLREQPNEGKTIIEKIEQYSEVGYSIVLYTPCDEGKSKSEGTYKDRARQNVVFEHGYLCAKLGRSNVCALVSGNIEIPGDMSGIVYISMQKGWQLEVAKELKSANFEIDANRLL